MMLSRAERGPGRFGMFCAFEGPGESKGVGEVLFRN